MATEVVEKVQSLFDKLETQRTILTTCTDLYKTLTSHFTSLDQTLTSKSETLDSKLQTLDSNYQQTLDDLQHRENSISDRLSSLTSLVESQKQASLAEFQKRLADDVPLSEHLKSLCRKMDASGLLKFVVARRKESTMMRSEIVNALAECVDQPRLVVDVVAEFVSKKGVAKGAGLTDKRWACGMVVSGFFPLEDLIEGKKNVGPVFSRAIVERAEKVVREWRERVEKGSGDGGEELSGMGPAEASMLLQFVLGFGLKDKFEEEFYKKLATEFAARRDMAKLAMPLFRDKVGDVIDELIKNGKEVEAVYFASESGLTERFQPASLLKSYLRNSKKIATDILKKGNHSSAATDEANNSEISSIKSIIKCVEDHKIDAEFPVESLRKRLSVLEKAKADKKKSSAASSKPSNKRLHGGGGARGGGPPPPRPAKMPKFGGPFPPYARRNPVSPARQSPVTRYSGGPYNYPTQTVYDAGLTASTYGTSYAGAHIPASDPITQQHYGIPGDSVVGGGTRLGGSYGGPGAYGSYDYSATAAPTYQPSSYTQ